jgi:signal peptidase II
MTSYLLILLAFLADRFSKWWAADYLAEHGPADINALFALRETYNRGIAFGMFQGIGPIVGWLTIGIVLGMFVYLRRVPRSMWLLRVGLALVIGGALGNLVDRVTAGQVLDFIQTPLRPGVFNVADVMIQLGLILAVIGAYWPGAWLPTSATTEEPLETVRHHSEVTKDIT